MTNYTKTILQLKDKNIIFNNDSVKECVIKNVNSLVFSAKLSYTPIACPCCGTVNENYSIVKNGTRKSRIQLISISGLPAYLDLYKQRFYCRSCLQSFTASTQEVAKFCHISTRLKQFIAKSLTTTVSESQIAKDHHVSVHTVRRITDTQASKLKITPNQSLPNHLGFDEFKSVSSCHYAMSFVYIDNQTHSVIDIVQDRKFTSLFNYFMRFSLKTRQSVETITIDMYEPYIQLITHAFPNAKIIMDPFHIVQALNRELNKARIKFMNRIRYKDTRLYNKFKRYWKLLLASEESLVTGIYQRFPLFDWLTNTGNIVDYLLEQNEELKQTYRIVQQLRTALHKRDLASFTQCIQLGLQLPIFSGLKRVLRTFNKRKKYIENTVTYSFLSNGPIEGINNKIKVLKRNAFGFRNYAHFRNRILLMMNLYNPVKEKKTVTQLKVA